MLVRRVGAAATAPVTLIAARDHLRVSGTEEDAKITALVDAACASISAQSGRAVGLETWEIADTGFSGLVKLPKSPVVALTSVKYYLSDVLTTATLADFRLYQDDDYTFVGPIDGALWPMGQTRPDGTVIRFTAGYTTLPKTLHHAVLMMVGHFFENPTAASAEGLTEVPLAVKELIGLERLGWAAG